MMKFLRAGGIACLLAASLAFAAPACAEAAQSKPLLVFGAASLKNALDAVDSGYKGARVKASYAASSALAKQIEAGAPADIFISADLAWMNYLEGKHLIRPETRRNLLGNALVLVAPAGSTAAIAIKPGFPLARLLGQGRLAVADTDAVPAGRYAKAALQKLGVWDSVKDRLAPAENVRAALLLVARGEVPFGIVYRTDAAVTPRVRIAGTFPADSHPPIVYPVAVTAASKAPEAAAAYVAYLKSAAARAIFAKAGFAVLP
jgi:molybdate transport system substrate-binding protein